MSKFFKIKLSAYVIIFQVFLWKIIPRFICCCLMRSGCVNFYMDLQLKAGGWDYFHEEDHILLLRTKKFMISDPILPTSDPEIREIDPILARNTRNTPHFKMLWAQFTAFVIKFIECVWIFKNRLCWNVLDQLFKTSF